MATIFVGEVKLPHVEIPSMARDFGLDITVPDGGLVSSAANQKQYKAECGRIYREFMVTMGDYIQQGEQLNQELKKLQNQKSKGSHIGKDVGQEDVVSETVDVLFPQEEHRYRRGGLITTGVRPQTAAGMLGKMDTYRPCPDNRPSTVAVCTKGVDDNITMSHSRRLSFDLLSDASSYYDGVIDTKSQNTKDRKLKMNETAFSKLLTGKVNVKLQHKPGEFVLKHITDNDQPSKRDAGWASDYKDKIALVKKKTNFKSPTLSSDMKINNLVAIQKSLLGLPAKRITVSEIMEKAKDRRARIFKVEVSGTGEFHNNALYNKGHVHSADDIPDNISNTGSHDGVKLVKMEVRNRRNSSSCALSQDAQDMKKYRDSFFKSTMLETPKNVRLNLKRHSFSASSRNMYLDTSENNGGNCQNEGKSERETPRLVTSRDVKEVIKRSMEVDRDRENKLNKWRQRMTFAAVKRNGLGRILSGAGLK